MQMHLVIISMLFLTCNCHCKCICICVKYPEARAGERAQYENLSLKAQNQLGGGSARL